MKYGQNNLLDIRGTIAVPFILFHPATWELRHETELRTTQKLGKMFSHSRYERTHAKLMGNSRKNMMQAYRQLERAEKCSSHFIMRENSSVKVVKEKNDE